MEELRQREFTRLSDKTYVDWAGSALYSEKQLDEVFAVFKQGLFANPHSQNSGFIDASDIEEKARQLTLSYLKASATEYECIFTSGATEDGAGAMKLVAELFPWSKRSKFIHSKDNHTSVIGIRGLAQNQGASIECIQAPTVTELEKVLEESGGVSGQAEHLFAYPLESNFSGARYDECLTSLLEQRQQSGQQASTSYPSGLHQAHEEAECSAETGNEQRVWVLLDTAKACSTRPPDLSHNKPHFVVLSYYKIFGYPTGLGALLVRKDAAKILQRRYFGGGTVLACSADSSFVRWREGPAGFEDGTNSFLGIAAIPPGFQLIDRIGGLPLIQARTQQLTRLFAGQLASMQHHNGQALSQLYGNHKQNKQSGIMSNCHCPPGAVDQGPTVTFNLLRPDGSFVGYREVEKLAELNGIALRGGCLCNPGACAFHLGLSAADVQENFEAGKVCWDDNDLIQGRPTGAIRVSFGMASLEADVKLVLKFIQENFLESKPSSVSPALSVSKSEAPEIFLKDIWVYPIKSCGGCRKTAWPLGQNGLLFDREWALVSEEGNVLTLGKHPQLALIQTHISIESGLLTVRARHMEQTLKIRLPNTAQANGLSSEKGFKAEQQPKVRINLCAESVSSMQMANTPEECSSSKSASEWFSRAVGKPCKLVQQQPGSRSSVNKRQILQPEVQGDRAVQAVRQSIGFANEAQLLLVNEASLQDLEIRLSKAEATAGQYNLAVERFRPNLVVGGSLSPYCEDEWSHLSVAQTHFQVAGPCARCKIICLDPATGDRKGVEPLYTLASYRRLKGQINFGILLQMASQHVENGAAPLEVGMQVHPQS